MPKIVLAEYRFHEAFKIPKGMDLEDKSRVTEWWIKWNKLYIQLVDETLLTIEPVWDNGDGMKEPVEATIEDGEEYNVKNEEGEESDDEECDEECDDDNRCEECCHCNRTRPCECGECDVVGGTCEAQSKKYEEEEEELELDYDAVVSGIGCRECGGELPPHTVREHLDVTSKIHQCPHVPVCVTCHLIECCCEADQLQVIADDERAIADGYREIDGRWIKPTVTTLKTGDIFRVRQKYLYNRYHYYKVVKVCAKTIKAVLLEAESKKIDDVEVYYGVYECSYVDEPANEILRQFKKTDITDEMINSSPHRYRIDAD